MAFGGEPRELMPNLVVKPMRQSRFEPCVQKRRPKQFLMLKKS